MEAAIQVGEMGNLYYCLKEGPPLGGVKAWFGVVGRFILVDKPAVYFNAIDTAFIITLQSNY